MNRSIAMYRLKLSWLLNGAAFVVAVQAPAFAHDVVSDDAANAREGDIVVTAKLRKEVVSDVPVLSGEGVDRSTIGGIADARKTVPGVTTYGDLNGIKLQIVIRGTPSGFVFTDASPVAYYLDSIPMGFFRTSVAPDASAYDLSRVEVLRGPQGTLYGASAQAGVVLVLTNDADVDEFEFKARGLASLTEYGGANYQGNVAANLPIVEGKLAARIVFDYWDFGGWIDRLVIEDVNGERAIDMRFMLQFEPTEKLTINALMWLSRADSHAAPNGLGNQTHTSTVLEPSNADYNIYSGRISYDLGFASLTSAASFLDTTMGNTLANVPAPFCNGCATLQVTEVNSNIFTQELTVASTEVVLWRWSAGAFYRDADDANDQTFPPAVPTVRAGFASTSKSYAIFGEVTRDFGDGQFEITGGLRRFHDKITTRDIASTGTYADKATFDDFSPRAIAACNANDDAMTYASFSRGHRGGSLQTPGPGGRGFKAAKPNKLFNYEVGAKASLFDNLLDVDLSVYYQYRKDGQQSLNVLVHGGTGTTFAAAFVNGPRADGFGGDFAFTLRPAKGMRLGVNSSINDLSFSEPVLTGAVVAVRGQRLRGSPMSTLGAFADTAVPLGDDFTGEISGSIDYRSKALSNRAGLAPLISESLLMGRANFALELPSRWLVTASAENITNDNGVVVADTFTSVWNV